MHNDEGRSPPLPRLLVFSVSHFCEKAVWACRRYGFRVSEEAHVPGFHSSALRAAGSSAGSVPCLVLPDGPTVEDSHHILKYLSNTIPAASELFPEEIAKGEIDALCARFDSILGPAVRMVVYFHCLDLPSVGAAFVVGAPQAERDALSRPGALNKLRGGLRRALGIDAAAAAKSVSDINAIFGVVGDRLLSNTTPLFLVGDRFTAADLTFAALAAPVLELPYGGWALDDVGCELPCEFADLVARLRNTPAGRHAVRLWAEERPVCRVSGPARL